MKRAIITGASSELGYSISQVLKDDYHLILLSNSHKLHNNNLNIDTYQCDFNNQKQLDNTIKKIKEKYETIDLLINVAARSIDREKENITSEEFLKTLNVNVVVPFILVQQLLKKDSIVINISSTDGIDTFNEYNLTYATSKSALIHETKQLALMYKDIHFYALALNYINTKTTKEMNPQFLKEEMQRIGQKNLIEIDDIIEKIKELITELPVSGTIIRMD